MEPDKAARAVAAVRGAIATNETSEPRSRRPLGKVGLSVWVPSLERSQKVRNKYSIVIGQTPLLLLTN